MRVAIGNPAVIAAATLDGVAAPVSPLPAAVPAARSAGTDAYVAAPDPGLPVAALAPVARPAVSALFGSAGAARPQRLVDREIAFAGTIARGCGSRRKNIEIISEASNLARGLEQVRLVKEAFEARIAVLSRTRVAIVSNLGKTGAQEIKARLKRIFDARNDPAFVTDLDSRRPVFGGDFAGAVERLRAEVMLARDTAVAKGLVRACAARLEEFKSVADAGRGEDGRLEDMIRSLTSVKELTRAEIAVHVGDVFDAETKTFAQLAAEWEAVSNLAGTGIAEILNQAITASDDAEARNLAWEIGRRLEGIARAVELDMLSRVETGLGGILAKRRGLALDLAVRPMRAGAEVWRREALEIYQRAARLENGAEDGGFERVHKILAPALKALRKAALRLNTEAGEFQKKAARAQSAGNETERGVAERAEMAARARVKILEFGPLEAIESRVRETLARAEALREAEKNAGQSGDKETAKRLRAEARTLEQEETIRPWIEAWRAIERGELTDEELRDTEGKLFEGRGIRDLEEEIRKAQEEVNRLRDAARELENRAVRIAGEQINAFYVALGEIIAQASGAIRKGFAAEGSALTELVLEAASFEPTGAEFDFYMNDVESNGGHILVARRRASYETLARAAGLFRESVGDDAKVFNAIAAHLPPELKSALAERADAVKGMTLPPEQQGRGRYYGYEIPEDLDLPDRIPLFDRPDSPQDAPYRQAGRLPRFFDIALGTAVMFPADGEVRPTDEAVVIGFHGATTQMSSINSLARWITTFPRRFIRKNARGENERRLTVVTVANPFHEFGPYDPRLVNNAGELARWIEAIRERYAGYEKPIILKGRSAGANMILEHRKRYDNALYIPLSGYNPTPYCDWLDHVSLVAKGRTINVNGVKAFDALSPLWTFHLPTSHPPLSPVMPMVGRRDDYLQETPDEYPEDFLLDHPVFRGVNPTDKGQLAFWQDFAREEVGGAGVDMKFYPAGGHFLYNLDTETPETVAEALADFGAFLDAHAFGRPG